MVDEKLRNEMTKAYVDGNYDKALKLSQKVDKQVLKSYRKKLSRDKTTKKEKGREI